jgi:nucleotide-binding universal stress UspA family protein
VADILFATDFSPTSESAGHFAGMYARRLGARLHLLHVLPARDLDPDPAHRLSELARRIGAPEGSLTEVVSGAAADEIVGYARRNGIALIIVGTHGRTGFSRALLGSVAERVMRHAPCPVLTVPASIPIPPAAEAAAVSAGEPATGGVAAREDTAGGGETCVVCAGPSKDLICESCRARIRGQAIDRKLQEMRAGRA